MSILLFFIVLLFLVTVHEFGHFIIAKKSGIRVDEFAFGFPPRIWAKKWGETTYAFNALPLGGYVKIYGEDASNLDPKDPDMKRSFAAKPRYIQSAVLLGGILFNFLAAWVLFTVMIMIGVPTSKGENTFGQLRDMHVIATQVTEGSAAEKAGVKEGDTLVSVHAAGPEGAMLKADINNPDTLIDFVKGGGGKPLILTISRDGKTEELAMTPVMNTEVGKPMIGVGPDEVGTLKLNPILAAGEGAVKTYQYTMVIGGGIFDFFGQIFHGKADMSQVSGPVGIVKQVGIAASMGFTHILFITAAISINLAVINLLPIPGLDGGRLFFVIIESIIRRPLPVNATSWANMAGFAALLILMLFVTYHDVAKLL